MASKKYIKDYELVEIEDDQGRVKQIVKYHGDYFTLDLDESQIKKNKREFILLTFAILIIHVAAGFVANPGTYQFYVALPYTTAFLPLLFMTMAVFRLPGEKRPYRKEEIGLSYDRIRKTSLAYLIITAVGLVGTLVYVFFFRAENALNLELVYYALLLISTLFSWQIFQKVRKIAFDKEEKADKSE